jgi:Zn-dependent protease
MVSAREIFILLFVSIVLGFSISFLKNGFSLNFLLFSFLTVFLVILINLVAKKITSFYLDSESEIDFWTLKSFGFKKDQYFKKPFPIGVFLSIIIPILTLGKLIWLATLTFDVKPKVYRAVKRHGLYSFSEMTESHIGLIAASGIIANLFFSFLGYLLGYTYFSKISLFYAFFNMIPISDLDGNKIFFGSIVLWYFLAALTLIGISYALFLI